MIKMKKKLIINRRVKKYKIIITRKNKGNLFHFYA